MPRPASLYIIAIVQLIISSLSILAGIVLLLLITGTMQIFSHDLTALPGYLQGLVVLGLLMSVGGVVATYGLWHRQRWGWIGSLLFQILCIINNGLAIAAGQQLSTGVYFSTALSLSLILSLCLPSVRLAVIHQTSSTDTIAP